MSEVVMPRLSDSMEEGTILKWIKQVGDEVAVGEELVEIETDKANMGYEADVAGTLLEILVQENESAPVGALIARIGDPGAELPSPTPQPAPEQPDSKPEPADNPPAPHPSNGNGRVKASPLARRIASELGVDLKSLSGSGPAGRIVKKDVESAAP